MDSVFDVPDPSDWLGTPVSKLAPVEAALRCQVCKDFFTTPVITSCSHTFCSLCIRRCLTTDGKCPTCRAEDQELRLRPNWIVQDILDTFQEARPEILQLGKDVVHYKTTGEQGSKKRGLEVMDSEEEEALSESKTRRKMTRSRRKVERPEETINDDIQIIDGLTQCPICHLRMKEEQVFAHLDVHIEPEASNGGAMKDASLKEAQPFREISSRSRTQPKTTMERLPQLNYSLLNDNALRKKLASLGMPNNGSRGLLLKRHTEWVNLVNSNCDSKFPKSKRELLHDLDVWERSQGRQIEINDSAGPSVMDKDFDGAGWALKHDGSFKKLIADARRKALSQKSSVDEIEGQTTEKVEDNPRSENNDNPRSGNDAALGQ